MSDDSKKRLLTLIIEKAFKYSDTPSFTLASGKMSTYYIDCRKVTHSAEGKVLIGKIMHEMIKALRIHAAGGLTMGADPIACALSYASFVQGSPVASFSIRKEPKGHGLKKQVEGDVREGDRVAIVEDVITTGGSTIKAIAAARNEGLDVVKVLALVDREEGGRSEIQKLVDDIEVLFTTSDLIAAYKARQP